MVMRSMYGETVDLRDYDLSNLKAYTTSMQGRIFFGQVKDIVIPINGCFNETKPTIHIGIFKAEKDGLVQLVNALSASPTQLVQAATKLNLRAIETCRGLYMDVSVLRPEDLDSTRTLKRSAIVAELDLRI